MTNNAFDRIVYRYWDSPTPDFVSYEIQATPESVSLKVSDFNGNREFSFPFDAEKFSRLLAAFEHHGIANCQRESSDESCVGGTTDRIACEQNNVTVFSGDVYHCGGTDMGDLCGDIDAFAAEFKSLVPKVDQELRKHGSGL